MAKPKLRFPEFTNDWEQRKLGELIEKYEDPVETPHDGYERVGIRSHAKGTFHSYVEPGKELEAAKMHRVAANKFILNITFAWEHAVAITDENDEGKLVSHRFPQFSFNEAIIPEFFRCVMLDKKFREHLALSSPGGAGRNRVLKVSDMMKYQVMFPSIEEQKRISLLFKNIDNTISLQQREVEALEKQKKAVMQKIFSQQIRFKKDDGTDYPEWEERALGELFDYERPDAYIVNSTEYKDKYPIPVLTANQAFILGYTNETSGIYKGEPVILFDDFTCDIKFADFPFKVKSSAMKLLHVKDNIPSVFAYNLLKHIDYKPQAHARHWISIMQPIIVCIPCLEEQQKIADLLSEMDNAIDLAKQELEKWKLLKKGLLQQMFV